MRTDIWQIRLNKCEIKENKIDNSFSSFCLNKMKLIVDNCESCNWRSALNIMHKYTFAIIWIYYHNGQKAILKIVTSAILNKSNT